MSGLYVCIRCRMRLFKRGTFRRNPQWHSKTPFTQLRALSRPFFNGAQIASKEELSFKEEHSDATFISLRIASSRPPDETINDPPEGPTGEGKPIRGLEGPSKSFEDILSASGAREVPRYVRKTKKAKADAIPSGFEGAEWPFLQGKPGTGRYTRNIPGKTMDTDAQPPLSHNAPSGFNKVGLPSAKLDPGNGQYPQKEPTGLGGIHAEILGHEQTPKDVKAARKKLDNSLPVKSDDLASAGTYPKNLSPILQIDSHISKGNLGLAWEVFRTHFRHKQSYALVHPTLVDLPLLKKGSIFRGLLNLATNEFWTNNESAWLRPSEVLLAYERAHLTHMKTWLHGIEQLTCHVLLTLADPAVSSQKKEVLFSELMVVWRLFFQCKSGLPTSLESIDEEWKSIVDFTGLDEDVKSRRLDFPSLLQHYHPEYPSHGGIALCAVLAFNIFSHPNPHFEISESMRAENQPFVKLIAHLLPSRGSKFHLQSVLSELENVALRHGIGSGLLNELNQQIKQAPAVAMMMIGAGEYTEHQTIRRQKPTALQDFYMDRIARATESADQRRLESLWEEVLNAYGPENEGGKASIPRQIYSAFLSGFMGSGNPNRAVDIWNHMIANGMTPDVYIWTAMLVGCRKARDLDGFNEMWSRMLQAGVRPDVHAWTVRISSLILFRRVKDGLLALEEMGKMWSRGEVAVNASRVKSKNGASSQPGLPVNPYPKPTIETINAAIHAIADLPTPYPFKHWKEKNECLEKVLRWAGHFQIKPDVVTYNTLIKRSIYEKNDYETFRLLRLMEAEGIQPDAATFTMLIRTFFDNNKLDSIPVEQRATKIMSLLEDLEKRGLKLNAYTYSQTIDRLIHQYQDMAIVRVVLEHMLARGLKANPVIYTSIMMHYFQQTPPDIASVDSLWLRITSTHGGFIDKILFDRVISGYAQAGEVGKMMGALTLMSKHGKLPGWRSLADVVRALVEGGDLERAQSIVDDINKGWGVGKSGVTGGEYRRRDFWDTVRSLGLKVPGAEEGGSQREKPWQGQMAG